jgi:hypothetical protein
MAKLNHLLLAGAAVLYSLTVPGIARSATVVGPPATVRPCTDFTFNVTIISCAGGYSGNLLQDSLTDPTGLQAVAALGGSGGTFVAPKLENLSSTLGIINFNTTLTGLTIFGFHAGGAGDGGEGTFFFSFNAGTGTNNVIQITSRLNANETGLSDAALFLTGGGTTRSATPEPATWTMMLIGFGFLGYSLRRRKPVSVRFT